MLVACRMHVFTTALLCATFGSFSKLVRDEEGGLRTDVPAAFFVLTEANFVLKALGANRHRSSHTQSHRGVSEGSPMTVISKVIN